MCRSRMIWTGGLLGLTLALGCQHTQRQAPCEECSTCAATAQNPPAPAGAAPQRLSLVPAPLAPLATPSLVPVTPQRVQLNPAPAPMVISQLPAPAAPRTLPPVTAAPVNPEQSAPPQSPWALPRPEAISPMPSAIPAPVAPTTPPAASEPSAPTPAPAPTPTVSASPTGPAPQYYNSPDYSILFGVLDYNARRGTWRLRYADAGDDDRFGGSVTLDGIGRQMDGYVSGQFVRVEGALADPDSRDGSPAYRVKDMRPGAAGK
jgi:hypothetical protein